VWGFCLHSVYETEVTLSLGTMDNTNDLRSSCVIQPDRIIALRYDRLMNVRRRGCLSTRSETAKKYSM
jgi:hypothetical protein